MNVNTLISKTIICPNCKSRLKKKSRFLFTCECSDHPFLDGILCLFHHENWRKVVSIKYIKEGNIRAAKKALVGKKYYYLFLMCSFIPNKFELKKIILTSLLSLLFKDGKKWFTYVISRKRSKTLDIATRAVQRFHCGKIFVDFGIGTGEISANIYQENLFKNMIGLDSSYQNLYFAKNTSCQKKEILLISANLDKKFPLLPYSIDCSLTTETLNYLHIPHFFNELLRVTAKKGRAVLTSIHNKGFNIPTYVITPKEIENNITNSAKTVFVTDDEMHRILHNNHRLKPSSATQLKKSGSYCLLLSFD